MDGFPWRRQARSRCACPTDVGPFLAFGQQAPDRRHLNDPDHCGMGRAKFGRSLSGINRSDR
jgi:hypothetical protein